MSVLADSSMLKILQSSDSKVRFRGLKSLSGKELDKATVDAVAALFRSDIRGVNKLQALRILRQAWPCDASVKVFREALLSDLFIAERAVAILGDIADVLAFDLLEDAYRTTRSIWTKIRVLGVYHKAPHRRVFEFLKNTSCYSASEDNVRASTVSMLGRVGNPTLARTFVRFLGDRNSRVRANAVEALGKCLSGRALAKLIFPLINDRNNRVRANALILLIRLGARKLEQHLVNMAGHANALFRASAAYALGEIPSCKAYADVLSRLLDDDDAMVMKQARSALRKRPELGVATA